MHHGAEDGKCSCENIPRGDKAFKYTQALKRSSLLCFRACEVRIYKFKSLTRAIKSLARATSLSAR
jgi:hypothetical protein